MCTTPAIYAVFVEGRPLVSASSSAWSVEVRRESVGARQKTAPLAIARERDEEAGLLEPTR